MLRKKIALVVGAGDFLGASIAKKFAKEGFLAVVTRRRGDLTKLTRDINSFGGEAYPFHSDARNEEQVVKGPSTVNNSLFVGSTADLAKLIKSETLKKD